MITKELEATLNAAVEEAARRRHEYVTLEHLLLALLADKRAAEVVRQCGGDVGVLRRELDKFLSGRSEALGESGEDEPQQTIMFARVVQYALLQAEGSGQKQVDGGNVLAALFQAEQSYAVYLLKSQGITRLDVLNYLAHGISKLDGETEPAGGWTDGEAEEGAEEAHEPLKAFTVDLVERAAEGFIDPLIGRSAELLRTIQILCRRRKNNPVYVGEPGVGKTAIAEGLALKIHKGEVPEVLKGAIVYALDMGAVLAGTK